MATRQATLSETDRRGGDEEITCQVVLSAPTESPGETTRAAIRRDLTEFFGSVGDDRDIEPILAKDSPAGFGGPGGVMYCYGDTTASVLDDLEYVASNATVTCLFATGIQSLGADHAEIVASLDRIGEVLPAGTALVIRGVGRTTIGSGEWVAMRAAWAASADAAIARKRSACKRDIRRWSGVGKDDGRAGLGFEWVEVGDDGATEWVPADDYDEVCSVLEMVRDGEISKRQAAAELDTSPRTIRRAIQDRADRYGL